MFGITSTELQGYYNGNNIISKTVLPPFRFTVSFFDLSFNETALQKLMLAGPMPIIQHWHILSVDIPNYEIDNERVLYGAIGRRFPIIKAGEGLVVSMVMEEDENGTIGSFVNWFQRRIISQKGLYHSPILSKIDRMIVEVENSKGFPVAVYTFHNCYLNSAGSVTYDYSSNESVKYNLSISSDWMDSFFPLKYIHPL
jgi:hypothetical protein